MLRIRHGALKPRVEVRLVWSSERSVTKRTIGSATGIAVLTRVRSDRKLRNERLRSHSICLAQSLKRSGSANEGAATRYSSGARNPTGPMLAHGREAKLLGAHRLCMRAGAGRSVLPSTSPSPSPSPSSSPSALATGSELDDKRSEPMLPTETAAILDRLEVSTP